MYTSCVYCLVLIPPLLHVHVHVGQRYTPKCDVFSFAITLWEMLARKVPTIDTTAHQPTYAILYQMAEGKACLYVYNHVVTGIHVCMLCMYMMQLIVFPAMLFVLSMQWICNTHLHVVMRTIIYYAFFVVKVRGT